MTADANIIRPDWLLPIICSALKDQWCTRFLCTTCGAWKFRSSILLMALIKIGVNEAEARGFVRRPGGLNFDRFDREKLAEEIISELRAIDQNSLPPRDVLTIILSDLESLLGLLGLGESLDRYLSDTPVGTVLWSMRKHEAQIVNYRAEREREEVEDKERRAERKRSHEEWLKTKSDPVPGNERIRSGGGLVHIFLKSFEGLTVEERLRVLAEERWFSLDVIPKELIPLDADLSSLTDANLNALIQKIDKRGGPWAKLKQKLAESVAPPNHE